MYCCCSSFFSITKTTHNKNIELAIQTFCHFFLETAVTSVIRPLVKTSCRWPLREGWVHGGFGASCSWGVLSVFVTAERSSKAMRFWVGEFFNWNFTGAFFPYIFPNGSYGGVCRVFEDGRWAIRGTSISRCRKKNKGVGDKNKEISPPKKNHLNV